MEKEMETITKKVMIHLTSTHSGMVSEANGDGTMEVYVDEKGEPETESEELEMDSEGVLRISDERVEIEYFETELTGMEGACTSITYERSNPGLITMLRTGCVETVLVFEEGQRNVCSYNTPEMSFELTVRTWDVSNRMTENGGEIELDYSLEFRGSPTEHTGIKLEVTVIE